MLLDLHKFPAQEKRLWKISLTIIALFIFVLFQSYTASYRLEIQQSFKRSDLNLNKIVKNDTFTKEAKPCLSERVRLRGTLVGITPIAFISNIDTEKNDFYREGDEIENAENIRVIAATSKPNAVRDDLKDRFSILFIPELAVWKEDIPQG